MVNKSKLIIIVLFCWVPSVCAINFQIYELSSEFGYCWDGLGRDWNGNIYVACGNGKKTSHGNAALFRFSFEKNKFEKLIEIAAVSKKIGNWRKGDIPGKVHSSIRQGIDGRMYFSTHSALEGKYDHQSGIYQKNFRGGHVYAFDPNTGTASDISAPEAANHEGLFEVAVGLSFAHDKKFVYAGAGYPFGNIYQIDMTNGRHKIIANTGQLDGRITRKIFSDKRGRLYYPDHKGQLNVYDPITEQFDHIRTNLTGINYISAVTYSPSGDNIYFVASPSDLWDERTAIFHFSVPDKHLEKLCDYDPTEGNQKDWRASLHLRWDLQVLYFINRGRLFSFDLTTGKKSTLRTDLPPRKLYGSNAVDRYGHIWFSQAGSNKLHRFFLTDRCITVCSNKHARFDIPKHLAD